MSTVPLIHREVLVDADPGTAFEVFTARIAHWWPVAEHSVYGAGAKSPFREDDNTDRPVSYYGATKKANELMAPVHNRMPVILHPGNFDRWLDRGETDRPPLDLLRPFPADEMEAHEANKAVGNVRNNGPEMLNSA